MVPNPNILADYLDAWKLLIVGANGLFSVKSAYQNNIYVRFLDTGGDITGQYKCIGCFPTIYPVYNLAYGPSKPSTVSINFALDKIEYTDLSST